MYHYYEGMCPWNREFLTSNVPLVEGQYLYSTKKMWDWYLFCPFKSSHIYCKTDTSTLKQSELVTYMVLYQHCNLQSTQMVQEAGVPPLPPPGQIQLCVCVCVCVRVCVCVHIYIWFQCIQEAKNFLRKTKRIQGWPNKETRGKAITQPRSHPIKKMQNLGMGWDRVRTSQNRSQPKLPLLLVCKQTG